MVNIFVTVGTSSCDSLVENIDRQIQEGKINGNVVAQIGEGSYEPKHMRYFRMVSSEGFAKGIAWADVVISTGGAGTLYDLLEQRKKVIVVPTRPWSTDSFSKHIKEKHVLYCDDFTKMHLVIHNALNSFEFAPFDYECFDINAIIGELNIDEDAIHPIEKMCFGFALFTICFFLLIFLGEFL